MAKKKTESIVPVERIHQCILFLRGEKVLLDKDLAVLYGVETRVLNQAVRRNINRFPLDFMFQLNHKEKEEVITKCDHLRDLKFSPGLPYAFTEQGVAMLSSVLKSQQAVEVNIAIMRTFVQLRKILSDNSLLRNKIESLERKYDEQFQQIFSVLEQMLEDDPPQNKKQIGYHTESQE